MDRSHLTFNAWRWKCGLPEQDISYDKLYSKEEVAKLATTQWCDRFEDLCRNRMAFGSFRYGNYKKRTKPMGYVDNIKLRIARYEKDGNTEWLLDVANLAMIEFEIGEHPNKHFGHVDDGDHHVQSK